MSNIIPRLLNEKQVSLEYGISRNKLRNDRWRNTGLPFTPVGKRIFYDRRAIEEYLQLNQVTFDTPNSYNKSERLHNRATKGGQNG